MIEIVLRKDIADFEPKPFFGFTARQVVTAAIAAVGSVGLFLLLSYVLHLPNTLVGYAILAFGAGAGAVGLGRVRGLKPESWLRITLAERAYPRTTTYRRPVMAGSPTSPYDVTKPKLKKADKKALKAERYEYTLNDLED